MINQSKNSIQLPNLNGLRFFAALVVLISHVELIKSAMGLNNKFRLMERLNLGGFGVYFFFVLSGFLITYLLLKEKERYNSISVKDFYLRRILRIWPLYYLIFLIGFFILPHLSIIKLNFYSDHFLKYFNENLILYLFILPNLAFSIFDFSINSNTSSSLYILSACHLAPSLKEYLLISFRVASGSFLT